MVEKTKVLTNSEMEFLKDMEYSPYDIEQVAEAVSNGVANEGELRKLAEKFLLARDNFLSILDEVEFVWG